MAEKPIPDEVAHLRAENERLHRELARAHETSFRVSEMQYMADAVPAFISFIDPDFRYRFQNKYYETALGIGQAVCGP